MIPTLWVAAGSALGGVSRYGVGLLASRLWGDSFPWGTIIINVVGSFVIGFFGALTVPEGALPASANLRVFVMVGICGGFTTFSSFSLQTLNLARDGGWLPAMGNVVLSVVLCIAAVTLGALSAERIGLSRSEVSVVPRSVVAVLDRLDTARPVLAAAALAAERLGDVPITALHIRHDAMEGFLPTEDVMTGARRAEIEGTAALLSRELRATLDDWRARGGAATWREVTGETARVIAEAAAGADLLVVGHGAGAPRGEAAQAVHAALFDAKRATLVVPGAPVPTVLGRQVALAWKPSAAASRAIDAALPLLRRAERVTVLIESGDAGPASEPADLLRRLRQAGVRVSINRFQAGGRSIGEALIAEAHAESSDLLVMGAFTHSRLEELVLGGATREVLAQADLPVLMHH